MGSIRKILFPTRFEGLAFPCLESSLHLARAGLEEVVFLYVLDRDEVGFVPFGGFDQPLAQELREKAKLHFADWGRALAAKGLRWKEIEEIGNPEAKILEIASRERVDLIVTGRQHHHPADRVYLGGTAMEIVRRSPVPVLVCKGHGEGESCEINVNPFKKLLLGTDFSACSEAAIGFVTGLGGLAQRVAVAHVIPGDALDDEAPEEIRSTEGKARRLLQEVCSRLEAVGIGSEAHLVGGDVEGELLRLAADNQCTGVVLGTKGRSGLEEIFLGSVSHRVVEASPVPVILVPVPKG